MIKKRCLHGNSSFGEAVGMLVGGCSPSASCIFHISKVCPKWSLHFILCLFAVLNFVDLCLKPQVAFCWLRRESESHCRDVTISFPVHLFEGKKGKWLHVNSATTCNTTMSLNTICIACAYFCRLFSQWHIASTEEIFLLFFSFPGGIFKLRGWRGGMFSGKALSTKCQLWNIERIIML